MLKRMFALSNQGLRDLNKGIAATTLSNLCLIAPVSLLVMVIWELLNVISGQESSMRDHAALFICGTVVMFIIVFQDVMLFDETVMENIRLGRGDATDEEVMAAARAAQCEEFIQRLPQGYQTNIGENGSALSGGERQRISIARALLKNAPIVLLDEATASMDAESETLIQDALSVLLKDKTVMVIAHRMRTVANADKIVVLDDGKVSEMGTPAELMKKGGLYAHLVELQQGK